MHFCRCIRKCVSAINDILFLETVCWPDDNRALARRFYEIAGMPAVARCVDGTHVRIESPIRNEEQYVNRHGEHSINTVCAAQIVSSTM